MAPTAKHTLLSSINWTAAEEKEEEKEYSHAGSIQLTLN